MSISELNERWQKEQKVLYWPDIAKREDPADFATRLTNHVKESDFYNTSPSISPQGDKVAFISDRDDYFDVYIMSTIDNKVTKIVDGQRTKNFEELHLLTPGITWSPDGKKIALAVKSGESDAIFIVDAATGNQEKIQFQLEGIFSVDWSPKRGQTRVCPFFGDQSTGKDSFQLKLNFFLIAGRSVDNEYCIALTTLHSECNLLPLGDQVIPGVSKCNSSKFFVRWPSTIFVTSGNHR